MSRWLMALAFVAYAAAVTGAVATDMSGAWGYLFGAAVLLSLFADGWDRRHADGQV